jgi:hypothetical protein
METAPAAVDIRRRVMGAADDPRGLNPLNAGSRILERKMPVINKSKRMVGILSLGDLSRSASGDLLSEWAKSRETQRG